MSTSLFNQPSNGDFALLTSSFILLPSPSAAHIKPYRTLFRKLHEDAAFCAIAFGEGFGPIIWDDEEMKTFLLERDAAQRWMKSGMGDFAVGVLENRDWFEKSEGKVLKNGVEDTKVVEGREFDELKKQFEGDAVKWVGYTCVRNAVTAGGSITDHYNNKPRDGTLPSQEEMIEVRYGMDPDHRGRGIATRAAKIAMAWAVDTRGVKRFIAETQKKNEKSQGLLKKLGFVETDEGLGFREEEGDEDVVVEWVKVVG